MAANVASPSHEALDHPAPSSMPLSRGDRRKALTRAALVRAAQQFLAEGHSGVAILEITTRAGVAQGTFYNHFDTKEQLFAAAVEEALEVHAVLLDELVSDSDEPDLVFAQRFRLTGRMHAAQPQLSRVVLNRGIELLHADLGFTPRARRDVERGIRGGQFSPMDVDVAMSLVFGAALALGQLLHDQPSRDAAATTDEATEGLLKMLGASPAHARKLAHGPLPDFPTLPVEPVSGGRVSNL